MLEPSVEPCRAPANLLDKLTTESNDWGLIQLEVTAKQPPASRRDDAVSVVTQLQQPAPLPLQHGQGHFNGH
jgi:hypothetical protein